MSWNWKSTKFLLVVLLLFSGLIRLWRIEIPREYVFDEVYHAFTAKMYSLERYEAWVWWTSPPEGVAYEWTHPPLGKVLMSWGINLLGGPGELPTKISDPELEASFTKEERESEVKTTKILGNNSASWRIPGAIFGVICTLGIFLLARQWFGNAQIGLLAGLLFSLDLLPLVQSRTAMNDIYAVTFLVYGFYFFTKRVHLPRFSIFSLLHKGKHRKQSTDNSGIPTGLAWYNWLLAGLMIGCAIASKWTSLFALGGVAFYQLVMVLVGFAQSETLRIHPRADKALVAYMKLMARMIGYGVPSLLKGLFCFGLVPLAIYLLSYWQLFTLPIPDYQGNDLGGDIANYEVPENESAIFIPLYGYNSYLADRLYIWWGLQKQMWWYHTNLVAEHNYTSRWWSWPLMVRPVWFYVSYCGVDSEDLNCQQLRKVWNEENLTGDIYTMGNPILYWAMLPLIAFVVMRYLHMYRWWFGSIVIFGIYVVVQYIFVGPGFEKPLAISAQAKQIFEGTFPQVLLFASLIFIFLALVRVGEMAWRREMGELREFGPLVLCLLAFALFWLPWSRSPRIMFYYHFFPPMTFMYLFMAGALYRLAKSSREMRWYVFMFLGAVALSFIYFYPHVTAFLLPSWMREQYWWFGSWK